jgi:hypothetical protein
VKRNYEVFLSYTGEIIIKNGESILIYRFEGEEQLCAFATDVELHDMLLFPLKEVPVKIWKRHKKRIKKFFSEN